MEEFGFSALPRKGFRTAEDSFPVGLTQPLLGPSRQPGGVGLYALLPYQSCWLWDLGWARHKCPACHNLRGASRVQAPWGPQHRLLLFLAMGSGLGHRE